MVETVFPGNSEPLTAPHIGPRDPDIYIPTDPPVDVPVDPPVYVPSDVPMDPPADFPSPDDDVEFPLERSPAINDRGGACHQQRTRTDPGRARGQSHG